MSNNILQTSILLFPLSQFTHADPSIKADLLIEALTTFFREIPSHLSHHILTELA